MEKGKKSIHHYMRALHRDIGFLMIGLTLIYAISGFILIFRDKDFLKVTQHTEKQLSPNLEEDDLADALRLRDFNVTKTEGGIIYFNQGTYNQTTGTASYNEKVYPVVFQKFNRLHMAPSKNVVHWFTAIYAILLIFLAISSFWMYKFHTRLFRRGILFTIIGLALSVVLLLCIGNK